MPLDEAGQNLGAKGSTPLRTFVLPLALPGYLAGASLICDELATPLLLNVTSMLVPQSYLRATSVGLADPIDYVISVTLVVVPVVAIVGAALLLRGPDHAKQRRPLSRAGSAMASGFGIPVLLLSFGTFSPLPDAYTVARYGTVLRETPHLLTGTLIWCGVEGRLDVVLGVTITWLVLRTKLPGRKLLDLIAMSAVAVPGLVLGLGILRTSFGVQLPGGTSLARSGVMLAIVYPVRWLPYALRAATVALHQVPRSFEEAPEHPGADKTTTPARIVVTLMAGGLAAAFVTSFATAAVELSATLVLAARDSSAPLSYGIYAYMQSPAGRGPGAALGVIAALPVAVCTFQARQIAERERSRRSQRGGDA